MKKLRLGLTLSALLALSASTLKANSTFSFAYTGEGISASGVLDTSGALVPDIDGSGQSGYQITGITGTYNGVAITGIVPNLLFPSTQQNGDVLYDNALLMSPYALDQNGLSYMTSDGNEHNVFSVNNPTGGGYLEALNGTYNYIPVDLAISPLSVSVPETSHTLGLASASFATILCIRRRLTGNGLGLENCSPAS